MNVPLFNQSKQYVERVVEVVNNAKFSIYLHKKVTNFIIKYDSRYYNEQQAKFIQNPDKYLSNEATDNKASLDLLSEKLPWRFVVKTVFKFFVHQLFIFIGRIDRTFYSYSKSSIIRKSYVEDVEGLFDNNCRSVVRVVFPFPLSVKRQISYIKYLKNNGKKYILDGCRYSLTDLCKFTYQRNASSYIRLETRAQIRSAMFHLRAFNLVSVQCSDEYDFGSIFYAKYMLRHDVSVHNSAHGVGKYLPYHSYSSFSVLTHSQLEFYKNFNPNTEFNIRNIQLNAQSRVPVKGVCFIFLGQYSNSAPALIKSYEISVLEILEMLSKKHPCVNFMYKKHPNNYSFDRSLYKNIILLSGVPKADDNAKLVQFSFYSTCHIDPNFEGEKFLIQTDLIRPQIVFGESADIVKLNMLSEKISNIIELKLI